MEIKKGDLPDEEFAKLCQDLFAFLPKIKSDLENRIKHYKQQHKKKRKFENTASPESAFGSLEERRRLVDAMQDAVDPVEPKDEMLEFPETKFAKVAKEIISELLNTHTLQRYMSENEGMSENVQTDILEWMQKTQNELEKKNPFWEEEIFIAGQKKKNTEEIANDISSKTSKIEKEYKALPSIDDSKRGNIKESILDFAFYRKEFTSQKEVIEKEGIETEKKKKTKKEIELEEISVEKKEDKGPIIICVDTSGSMHGTAENIAKTLIFALAKIALEEMRKCFVISFSTDIETLEVKPNDDMEIKALLLLLITIGCIIQTMFMHDDI